MARTNPSHQPSAHSAAKPPTVGRLRRFIRRVRLPILLTALLFLLIMVPVIRSVLIPGAYAQQDDAGGLKHTATIALDGDGNFDLGEKVNELGSALGIDKKVQIKINVRDLPGMSKLRKLGQATNGILHLDVAKDKIQWTLDRDKLRTQEQGVRGKFRGLMEEWFPEQAAKAKAQYGVRIHSSDTEFVKLTDQTPSPAELILLIHGLDEPGWIWDDLRPALLSKGHATAILHYPNDQPIAESAKFLAAQLELLKKTGTQKVTLIAHSMGGLASREVLTNPIYYGGKGAGGDKYPRIDRLVMVGTPNHGSQWARLHFIGEWREQAMRLFSSDGLWLGGLFDGAGEASIDLLPNSEFIRNLNARPHPSDVPYTIIAGKASPVKPEKIEGWREKFVERFKAESKAEAVASALKGLVEGLGDGVVTIDSARLEGVKDFVQVDANHHTMLHNLTGADKEKAPAPSIPIILERLAGDRK